jgi:G:T-mismatch repair DNA endonuclease (very short patch repair protein)
VRNLIGNHLTGGQAQIYLREAIAGVSRIRGGKLVRKVVGYDANALYPSTFYKPLPTGFPVVHQLAEPGAVVDVAVHGDATNQLEVDALKENIKRNLSQNLNCSLPFARNFYEIVWVIWQFKQLQLEHDSITLTLRHQFNGGQKRFVFGKNLARRVDGWIPELRIILQYHGCRFHGHKSNPSCRTAASLPEPLRTRLEQQTERDRQLLLSTGCRLIEKQHCDFMQEAYGNEELGWCRFIEI